MKPSALFLFMILFLGAPARAVTLTETFDSRSDFASGTAVWNQALGKIHSTLIVRDYATPTPTPFDLTIGDGSDGAFDNTTYANFSVGGDVSGNIIRLDTIVHPQLQVTHFTLDQGWKIIPVGSNPLIIKSLSTVKILGEIHCEGVDGTNSASAATGTGGAGRCGGFAGGDGGAIASAGADGTDASGAVTGGRGGDYNVAHFVGGGGGGSWSGAGPTNGGNSSASGGEAGANFSEPDFSTIAGGAGGGGGSGDATTAGGGGGGGGGAVIIHAVGDIDIGDSPSSIFGYIFAGGGKGGDASDNGGPGGGGGGGSIQLFSGGLVNLFNTDVLSASQALGGVGGTNIASAPGATGGRGRSWISTSTFFTGGTGTYTPIEEFPVNTGLVEFNSARQTIITRVFDTANNFVSINSLTLSPVSSDFLFEISGSSDGFASDDTGWTANPAVVADKRYLKMRLSIQTSNPALPDMIDTATLTYSLGSLDNFTFQSAGCGRVGGSAPENFIFLVFAPLMLLVLKFKAKRKAAR